MTKSESLGCALYKTGDISRKEALTLTDLYNAEVG